MCLEAGLGLGWVGVCESGLVEEQEGARPDRRQPEKHVVDRIWGRAYSSGAQAEDNSLTPSSPPALYSTPHPCTRIRTSKPRPIPRPHPGRHSGFLIAQGPFRGRRSRQRCYPSGLRRLSGFASLASLSCPHLAQGWLVCLWPASVLHTPLCHHCSLAAHLLSAAKLPREL